MTRPVRVVRLAPHGGLHTPGLLVVEAGARLVFCLPPDPGVDLSSIVIWTNIPPAPAEAPLPFNRSVFFRVDGDEEGSLDGTWHATLDVPSPGAFELFLEFERPADGTLIDKSPRSTESEALLSPVATSSSSSSSSSSSGLSHASVQRVAARGGLVRTAAPSPAKCGPLLRIVVNPALSVTVTRLPGGVGGKDSEEDEEKALTAPDPLLPGLTLPATGAGALATPLELPLPLDGLCLQTQLTRCLGPIDSWLTYACSKPSASSGSSPSGTVTLSGALAEPVALKYNMLHFTPPQVLGASGSAYSLGDQLCLEPGLFAGNAAVEAAVQRVMAAEAGSGEASSSSAPLPPRSSPLWRHPSVEAVKTAVLSRLTHELEAAHGTLSLVDVVLNHTAADSHWLSAHPEAAYNLTNSPHLRAAFELDEAMLRVSAAVAAGTGGCGHLSPAMRTPADVDAVVDVLQHHPALGLPASRLWEFFVTDVWGGVAGALAPFVPAQLTGGATFPFASLAEAAAVGQDQNVAGVGWATAVPPAPLVTPGVPPPALSPARALEVGATRHPLMQALYALAAQRGYLSYDQHGPGGAWGEGIPPVADAELARLAAALVAPRPPPDVTESLSRLRALTAERTAQLAGDYSAAVEAEAAAAAVAAWEVEGRGGGDLDAEAGEGADAPPTRRSSGASGCEATMLAAAAAAAGSPASSSVLTLPASVTAAVAAAAGGGDVGGGGPTHYRPTSSFLSGPPAGDGHGSSPSGATGSHSSSSSGGGAASPPPRPALAVTIPPPPPAGLDTAGGGGGGVRGTHPNPWSPRAYRHTTAGGHGSSHHHHHHSHGGGAGDVPPPPHHHHHHGHHGHGVRSSSSTPAPRYSSTAVFTPVPVGRAGAVAATSADAGAAAAAGRARRLGSGRAQVPVALAATSSQGGPHALSSCSCLSAGADEDVHPFSSADVATPVGRWGGFSPLTPALVDAAAAAGSSSSFGGGGGGDSASPLAGGVWNDGSGGRFSVHADPWRLLSALNALPGVRVDPSAWVWPFPAGAAAGGKEGVSVEALLEAAAKGGYSGRETTSPDAQGASSSGRHLPTCRAGLGGANATTPPLGLLPSLHLLYRLLEAVNLLLFRRYDEDVASALASIRGAGKYQWLTVWRGEKSISLERPLVWSYFCRRQGPAPHAAGSSGGSSPSGVSTPGSGSSGASLASQASSATGTRADDVPLVTHVLACNGFIWNGDAEIDFTLPIDAARGYAELVARGTGETAYVRRDPLAASGGSGGVGEGTGAGGSSSSVTAALATALAAVASTDPAEAAAARAALLELPVGLLAAVEAGWKAERQGRHPAAAAAAALVASVRGNNIAAAPVAATPGEGGGALLPPLQASSSGRDPMAVQRLEGLEALLAAVCNWPLSGGPSPSLLAVAGTGAGSCGSEEADGVGVCSAAPSPVAVGAAAAAAAAAVGLPAAAAAAACAAFPSSSSSTPPTEVLHLDPRLLPLPLASASTPYFRRDIVIWGDCVKLRYGFCPADSPYLWWRMAVYVRRMARLFHGLRIDNAHGTPLHVATAMVDAAREVRPHLYVNAELFTGSVERDVEYSSRLGIHSLVREAMQSSSAEELVGHAYRYGGQPLGALRPLPAGSTAAARLEAALGALGGGARGDAAVTGGGSDVSAACSGSSGVRGLLRSLVGSSLALESLGGGGEASSAPVAVPAAPGDYRTSLCGYSCSGGLVTTPTTAASATAAGTPPRRSSAGGAVSSPPAPPSPAGASLVLDASASLLAHLNEAPVLSALPSPLPAMLFDCTHDNPVPSEKQHAVNALPLAALVTAAPCAGGSSRGFDILVPETVHVVHDHRRYAAPPSSGSGGVTASVGSGLVWQPEVDLGTGIRAPRRRLNALKQELAVKGLSEFYASTHPAPNGSTVVLAVRAHPALPLAYAVITRTAFSRWAGDATGNYGPLPSIVLDGQVTGVVLAASLAVPQQRTGTRPPEGPLPDDDDAKQQHQSAAMPNANASLIVVEPPSSLPAVFHAAPRVINGLASCLTYRDEGVTVAPDPALFTGATGGGGCSPEVSLHRAALGLARFSLGGSRRGGGGTDAPPTCTVTLDPERFQPGSVLVLKLKAPRNVGIRSVPSVLVTLPQGPAHQQQLSAPPHRRSVGARLRTTVLGVLSAVLHGPPPRRTSVASIGDNDAGSSSGVPLMRRPTFGSFLDMSGVESSGGGGEGALVPLGPLPSPGTVSLPIPVPTAFHGPSLSALHAVLVSNPAVTLVSLNALLYRSEPEERDASGGARGVYVVPNHGRLPWAGFAGVHHALLHCRRWNDMAHPLLSNLRAGSWLLDYCVERLAPYPELAGVRDWVAAHFAILKVGPPGLVPQGFDRVATAVFHAGVLAALQRMRGSPLLRAQAAGDALAGHPEALLPSAYYVVPLAPGADTAGAAASSSPAVFEGHSDPLSSLPLPVALALTSVQLFGSVPSAPLLDFPCVPPSPPSSAPPAPLLPSLAAGVDHFCTGYMRTWGRDAMISLRGLLLVTGRFEEARGLILAFAAVVRHGLVPNLMDGGRNPRYNCRDAVWWWLQAVQDYCSMAPEGTGILDAPVHRRFPSDDQGHYSPAATGGGGWVELNHASAPPSMSARVVMPLSDILHECLSKHAAGISFREWNAGRRIDAHMRDEGFNVAIGVDPSTGFVHGGNRWNCGTWMDKMGEAPAHGTDGVPATPRDGADVEIIGLAYSATTWLARLARTGAFHHTGVTLSDGAPLSYADWSARIAAAFETHFYVPPAPGDDWAHRVDGRYVHRRGIYKDTVGSSQGWPDYQLRPNVLVAMAVAPGLFTPARAAGALLVIERQLLGPTQLGVKTLDPADWAFRGSYDNASDADAATAKGFNYHQGPEWLWPFGYYLRARIRFPPEGRPWSSAAALRRWVHARLAPHRSHLEASPEGGLPELTNAGNVPCRDSCVVQAWSSATLLDALYDLNEATAAGAGGGGSSGDGTQ